MSNNCIIAHDFIGAPALAAPADFTFLVAPGNYPMTYQSGGNFIGFGVDTWRQYTVFLNKVRIYSNFADGLVFRDANYPELRLYFGNPGVDAITKWVGVQFPTLNEWYDVNLFIPILSRSAVFGEFVAVANTTALFPASFNFKTISINPAYNGMVPAFRIECDVTVSQVFPQ